MFIFSCQTAWRSQPSQWMGTEQSYEAPMHLQALQISQSIMQTRQSAPVWIKPQTNIRSMSAMNSRIRNELERKSCQTTNPNHPTVTGGAERRRRSHTKCPRRTTAIATSSRKSAHRVANSRVTVWRLKPAPLPAAVAAGYADLSSQPKRGHPTFLTH